ncbi:MAG: hypothetical protein IJU35_07135 [Paludibacteraceae bacterium]|nr:hypothetical protein [Paludibacteraceae bacterium]
MNILLISMFGRALRETPLLDCSSLNAEAMKRGYFVHPEACTDSVRQFIEDQPLNINSTFYKRWQDVVEKSRLDLLLDQLTHYATTYGTDFSMGNGYVPNDGAEVVPYKEYKIIFPITEQELVEKCLSVLTAGIALKRDTMLACVDYVAQYMPAGINVDDISNREAQVALCDKLNLLPNNKFSLLRYIIFKTTGSTLLIKNKALIQEILRSKTQFDFRRLNDGQLSGLASIFLRFKPLFLAFKHQLTESSLVDAPVLKNKRGNAKIINRLRRLAKKLHKPMPKQLWAEVVSNIQDLGAVRDRLSEITLFKVVALMQLCKERLEEMQSECYDRLYVIRNQKIYLRQFEDANNMRVPDGYADYLRNLYALLEDWLVSRLRQKACPVKFPVDYQLALPSTEKSFVGNMPFGTKYKLQKNNYIGIYWRNEWGTHDFDLSVVDERNQKFGWDAQYYNLETVDEGVPVVVFSGDMTNADPEATEIFYLRQGVIDGMVYVNRYSGEEGSKFKLFFGQQEIARLTENYMVDPHGIKLSVDMESNSGREQVVGLIADNTVTLMEFTIGNARSTDGTLRVIDAMRRKAKCFIPVETILRKAGFVGINDEPLVDSPVTPELDLTQLDKSTLIKLMS